MSWWDRQVYKSDAFAGSANGGLVSTEAQTFAGAKTFADAVIAQTTLEVLGHSTFDTAIFEDTVEFDAVATHDADIVFTPTSGLIRSNTVDADDDKSVSITGGGALSVNRGSAIRLNGNEAANTGQLEFYAGNVAGGEMKFYTDATVERLNIPKDGGIIIKDDSGITTPTAGNLLYSASGALISRNSGGAEWALNPAWVSWTPTFDAAGAESWSPTIAFAKYLQIGKCVWWSIALTAGNVTGSPATISFTLPVTVLNGGSSDNWAGTGFLEWGGTANRATTTGFAIENTTDFIIYTPTLAAFVTGNARFIGSGFYQAN